MQFVVAPGFVIYKSMCVGYDSKGTVYKPRVQIYISWSYFLFFIHFGVMLLLIKAEPYVLQGNDLIK